MQHAVTFRGCLTTPAACAAASLRGPVGPPSASPRRGDGRAKTAATMLERDGLKIRAARVRHPPISHAYRFDAPDRSMVLAGATTYSPELIALAKEADVPVRELMRLGGRDRLLASAANAPSLCKHLFDRHTDRAVRPGGG
jgi:ribonuclease BN (tRNA processing enzyme)